MHRIPEEASEDTINELWEGGPKLPIVIDLTARAYDIDIEYDSGRPIAERWRAIDLNTFDGGPDAPGCFQGYGASEKQARMALLEQFAIYDADEHDRKEAERAHKPSYVVHSSPFEPPTYAEYRRDESEDEQ